MNKVASQVKRLSKEIDCQFEQTKEQLVISVATSQRTQSISIVKRDKNYVLTSVVLGTSGVRNTVKRWRDLARLAWHRNAEHQIVTFAFDKKDRLVGQISHPIDHLDYEELRIYVFSLARECDRFEYLVSGTE